jgi:hypothetical protein
MTSRGFVVAVAVASVVLLSGCTAPRAAPAGPDSAEVAEAVQRAIDIQWTATGLEGRVERPVIEPEISGSGSVWGTGMSECAQLAAGPDSTGWGYGDTSGFTLGDGTRGTDEQQLAFYSCFALHPQVLVLSEDQREFIFDYYVRTLIPCLGLHGYELQSVPARADFVSGRYDQSATWVWSPDSSMLEYPQTEKEYVRLFTQCPPTIPGVDGWSRENLYG